MNNETMGGHSEQIDVATRGAFQLMFVIERYKNKSCARFLGLVFNTRKHDVCEKYNRKQISVSTYLVNG